MHQGISRFRKMAVAAAATVATTAGLLPLAATPAGATSTFSFTRFAGADRYETAQQIAVGTFGTSDNVLIATGENFPDALAGNYLAGNKVGPILLTQTNTLPASTKAALATLKAKNVTLLGLTAAISQSVEDALKATDSTNAAGGKLNVSRVGGATRYDTAKAVAALPGAAYVGLVGGKKTALLASGENFPDALAGGPESYASKLPTLLTTPSALSAQASSSMQDLGVTNVIILGGTAAVSSGVESSLTSSGISVTRIAGADRNDTAAKLADYAVANLGFSTTHVNVATGVKFPDALAGGPNGGQEKAVTLLTASVPPQTQAWLQAHANTLNNGHLYGGVAAVSQADEDAMEAAAGATGTTGTSATSLPELQSATVLSTNVTEGTVVRYCFDETVTNTAAPGSFLVYTAAGAPGTAAGFITNSAADNKCVEARFAGITSSAAASALTLGTVLANAVLGNGGATDLNPIGDAGLGSAASVPLTAGVTTAPDLTSVSAIGPDTVTPGNSKATLNFDETAYVLPGAVFRLVKTSGTAADDVACTYVSGTGSNAIVVTCLNPVSGGFTSANTARAVILAGSVTDDPTLAAGNVNPLEAADVAASAGPDLVSATLQSHVSLGGGVFVDRIIYTFDEVVTTPITGPANFMAYTAGGTAVANNGTVARNSANTAQVAVDFLDQSLATAVGANVATGGVTGFTSTLVNRNDEEGMSNSGTVAQTPGLTAGPDLVAVTIRATTDAFGNITGYVGIFSFDERITAAGAVGSYTVYLANGTPFACTATAPIDVTTPGTTDKNVVCTTFAGAGAGNTSISTATLGTVAGGAVTAQDAGPSNPEGASATTKSGF